MNKKEIIVFVVGVFVIFGIVRYTNIQKRNRASVDQAVLDEQQRLAEEKVSAEVTYRIDQENSEAQFSITETLRGKPFTAVGKTNKISGDIIWGAEVTRNPVMKIGVVRIDATSFVTDSKMRDGAINKFILNTSKQGNESITFIPTAISSFPETIKIGEPFSFSIEGDVKISGMTKKEIFAVTALKTEDSFSGEISGKLKRSDFGLKIPSLDFIANVADVFDISVKFVANKVQ